MSDQLPESDEQVWRCPVCPWEQRAHPFYGWSTRDDRAVEVHRTMLCPVHFPPGRQGDQ